MTKKQLVLWSVARDTLDLLGIGQIPPLNWILNVPVQVMHFAYAGRRSATCLLEMIPLVGILPIFTIAALSYPNRDDGPKAAASPGDPPVVGKMRRLFFSLVAKKVPVKSEPNHA